MTPSQQYNRSQAYLTGPSSDVDRQEGTRWACAAAFQGHPQAYFALAKFYMGIEEGADGRAVLSSEASRDPQKFNVPLGLAFLVLAKQNMTDPVIAARAENLYSQVLKVVAVRDAIQAQRFIVTWEKFKEKKWAEGRESLSLDYYDAVPCSWDKWGNRR